MNATLLVVVYGRPPYTQVNMWVSLIVDPRTKRVNLLQNFKSEINKNKCILKIFTQQLTSYEIRLEAKF